MRKWRGNGERFTLYISSFSLYFLPVYPFPMSKNEKMILGEIRSEKGPQVVRACNQLSTFLGESYHETASFITNRRPYECWEY